MYNLNLEMCVLQRTSNLDPMRGILMTICETFNQAVEGEEATMRTDVWNVETIACCMRETWLVM